MPKCDFNKVTLRCFAALLKSHFGLGVLLYICYIFSEHKNTSGRLLLVVVTEQFYCHIFGNIARVVGGLQYNSRWQRCLEGERDTFPSVTIV